MLCDNPQSVHRVHGLDIQDTALADLETSSIVQATNCGVIYHLLALSFSMPNSATGFHLKQTVGELGVEVWDDNGGNGRRLPMAPFIRSLSAFDPDRLESVQREYVRLFGLGIGQHEAQCLPIECAYRPDLSADRLACTLQETYGTWGIDVPLALACRVETQLEFLAFLCRHEAEKGVPQAKDDFLDQHARRWLPDFAAQVAVHTQLLCFRTAANLLAAFLQAQCPLASNDSTLGAGRLSMPQSNTSAQPLSRTIFTEVSR